MVKSQEWFEVPHRSYGATTAIYQVGQVITDPLDLDSALFRNGSFNGMTSHEISQTIRQEKALTVSYPKTESSFEVYTGHNTAIEGARIDGKGASILWQVLEEERIYRNDTLLKAVIQEEEITRYLARPDSRKPLYLVTDVIKVQEIIPEYYDPGMIHLSKDPFMPSYPPPSPDLIPSARFAAPSASEDLHLPVGFDGRKHGKPFVWKYKLERVNNPEDVESVSAERILPSQALSDRDHTNWILLIINFLLGWLWFPSQQKPIPNGRTGDSSVLSARPTTLEWRVELENLTPSPLGEPNGILSRMAVTRPTYRTPSPPGLRLRRFSQVITSEEASHSDESDDDYQIRPRIRPRAARSMTHSLPRERSRRRRGTNTRGETMDASDWESKSVSIPYRRNENLEFKSKRRDVKASWASESVQSVPATAKDPIGPSSVETALLPDVSENKVGEKNNQNMGILESLGEAQTTVNGTGNNKTAAESKAERLEDHSSTKSPSLPVDLTVPAGIPHAEYEVFDSESADLANHLSQGDDAIKEGRKWFNDAEYMKKVNKFFEASRSGRPNERAKIAVLDTGLDFDHLLLRPFVENKRLSRENSLDFTVEPNTAVNGDNVGHGTHCTHLVLKTCETAEVYVAKVFKKKKADQYTAMRVAKVRGKSTP
ncbi:hypothetical protein F5Y06DRAFT_287770 [Hypoxylon sp. FL0890]|nr:hypothetical protein F5Y06DRAFT_287770 [Hypoxylon sp. FL0890]